MVYLNFFFIGDDVCLHSVDCCFDSGVTCDSHVSSRDCVAQEVITLLTVSCQKGQRTGLPFHFVFFCKHLRHPAWTPCCKHLFINGNFLLWSVQRVELVNQKNLRHVWLHKVSSHKYWGKHQCQERTKIQKFVETCTGTLFTLQGCV
jgi:hypothetical protein